MNIPKEYQTHSVEHRYGGNGWAVVANRKDEWMDLINASKITPGSQIFHVWNKCVSLEKKWINEGTPKKPKWVKTDEDVPIHPSTLDKIQEVRAKLASGEYVVKNTRLVKAVP